MRSGTWTGDEAPTSNGITSSGRGACCVSCSASGSASCLAAPRDRDIASGFAVASCGRGTRTAVRADPALAACRAGAPDRAEPLVLEAVSLVDATDSPCQRADVRLDLAEVKRLGDKPEEAAHAVEGAIRLYGQKGDVPSSLRARGLLAELAVV